MDLVFQSSIISFLSSRFYYPWFLNLMSGTESVHDMAGPALTRVDWEEVSMKRSEIFREPEYSIPTSIPINSIQFPSLLKTRQSHDLSLASEAIPWSLM